jgi:hypothetical protein
MKMFTCQCKWTFLVGKKKVYGPIYEGSSPRVMPRKEFDELYADCAADRRRAI